MIKEKNIILVIEDDYAICKFFADELEDNGFTTYTAVSAGEALKVLNAFNDLDLIVTDLSLGGALTGLDVSKTARKMHPNIPIIYLTGSGIVKEDIPNSILLTKPITIDELVSVINNMLEKQTII